jgi:hypothetical protein
VEQQEHRTEVVNVDTVRSLDDLHLNQQIGVRRLRKLKKWTQGNGMFQKKLDADCRRVICHAVTAVRKGNMHKRPGRESSASGTPQKKAHSSIWG